MKNRIPLIIHQIKEEDCSTQLSMFFSSLSNSWIQKHPLWEYRHWSLQDIKNVIISNFFDLAFLCQNDINAELLLKVARYFILYQEGGVFVDSDFECIEPFDELVSGKSFSIPADPHDLCGQMLSDSIVISEKKHPFLEFIISNIMENIAQIEEGGSHFINLMFHKYCDKDDLSILPFYKMIPCTRDEIKLYCYGLLNETDIEEKISKAYAICYYKKSKKTKKKILQPKRFTDILYVSTSVGCVGGAFNAGYRIHLGLQKIGINSKMLVLNSGMSQSDNILNGIYIASRRKGDLYGYNCDMQPLYAYPHYSISTHGFSPAVVGVDIINNIREFNPKLVILHGINGGFATIEALGRIQGKVVWRLPDCWAFTGGCYYFGDCKRYLTGCGKCPKLGSNNDNDLSKEVWKRKRNAWKKMDLTVVVPTMWMKKLVENSTLLKDIPIYVIPNGLDIKQYYPIEKQTARKALCIPSDKKVILFGAINAFDPRKGFVYLLKALQQLSKVHGKEYYLVIFGAESRMLDVDIPTKFLGYIHDQYILQLAYSAADIMVVPSLEEAFGQTVTEAMACATPVVSFLETGPESIIEHKKTGYLASYADELDLAKGIEWILSSTELIDKLSTDARYRIENSYDIKIIAKQYEKLYHQLLDI